VHKFPAPRQLERRAHLYELDKSSSYIRAEINSCPHFFCRRRSSCATTAVTANTLFPIYCTPLLCFAYKMQRFFSFWRTSRGREKWAYFRSPPIFSPFGFHFTVEHLANIFINLLRYLFFYLTTAIIPVENSTLPLKKSTFISLSLFVFLFSAFHFWILSSFFSHFPPHSPLHTGWLCKWFDVWKSMPSVASWQIRYRWWFPRRWRRAARYIFNYVLEKCATTFFRKRQEYSQDCNIL
jgi:hypothetical protein